MSYLGIESQNAQSWLEIGDLAALLDAEERLRLLVDSGVPVVRAEATYIRLKPGSGALVGLELRLSTPAGEISLPGYVRTHAPARAAELARKWHSGRAVSTPVGDGVRLLQGGQSVLFLFPNDARIPGLRFIAEAPAVAREIAAPGREYVLEHYTWAPILDAVERTIDAWLPWS